MLALLTFTTLSEWRSCGVYNQILGPRRHLPEFADGLCRHGNARFHLNPHMTWQATKSYV